MSFLLPTLIKWQAYGEHIAYGERTGELKYRATLFENISVQNR